MIQVVLKSAQFRLLLSYFLICLWLGGCGGEDLPAIALPEVACQPEDVATTPPFIVSQTRTAVPENTFLADQIVDYYGVELIENALTNAAVFCDLFVMADEAAAAEMLNRTCTEMAEAEPPPVGEEVCVRESTGFRMVNFRQGNVVVSILGDNNGFHVDDWAEVVNGRLPQK